MKKTQSRMRPVIIIPKRTITKKDIGVLRDNGICVVEATDPSAVRFIEPPPMGYSVQEQAAIRLCRLLFDTSRGAYNYNRAEIQSLYARFLIHGTPLDEVAVKAAEKAKS